MDGQSLDYLRDPAEIYRRSFELVRAEADLSALPESLHPVAIRLVHACGMPDIVADLRWQGEVAEAGAAALARGAALLTDCEMAARGIIHRRLPGKSAIHCFIDDPATARLARERATTRSAAAVEQWRPLLRGAVVVIGNAPTALYRLLEALHEGAAAPALILAFPVGFVGAAEAKEALVASDIDVPYLTLLGRRGGSALAAAAVNALAGGAG